MLRPQRTNDHRGSRRTAMRSAMMLFGFFATAGMLIWGKLRLVGDLPRTAWAEPEAATNASDDQAVILERDPSDD